MSKYNNELHKHKAADTIKWIVAFVLIIAILGAVVCLALQVSGVFDFFKKDDATAEEPKEAEGLEVELPHQDNFAPIALSYATTAASGDSFTKTLTATVTGETTNKNVEWKIEWYEGATHSSDDVQTYVKMTTSTTSTGGTATLQCLKGFGDDKIVVTATTVVGKHEAYCYLSFDGAPTTMTLSISSLTAKRDSSWGIDIYELDDANWSKYDFNIKLDNAIHSVGSKYGKYTVKIEGFGSMVGVINLDNSAGSTEMATNVEMGFSSSVEVPDGGGEGYIERCLVEGTYSALSQSISGGGVAYCSFSVLNSVLSITSFNAFTLNTKYGVGGGRGAVYNFVGKSFKNSKAPYCKVTITENTSKVSASINVRNIELVSSFGLSANTIVF